MTKSIKNPGLGGTPYRDDDSMLFEMLGVYRRPNLPPTPDGPGPATPPNPGGNVPGGKSNSGGGGKSGGGKGKGPQGDKIPPGQMKGGGGGSTDLTTQMDEYTMRGVKVAASGSANGVIDTYLFADESGTASMNASTGVWTCPQTGPYLLTGGGKAATNNSTFSGVDVQKYNGATWDTIHTSGWTITSSTTNVELWSSFSTLQQFTAGDQVRLIQRGKTQINVRWVITSVWTDHWFYSKKAAASGSINSTIDSYDSVTGLSATYGEAFDTSTGIFTCPKGGPWVFTWGGNCLDNTSNIGELRFLVNGGIRSRPINHFNVATSRNTLNTTHVYNLNAGDTVRLFQAGGATRDTVHFGGYRLHTNSPGWSAYDSDSSASAPPSTYSGYDTTNWDGGGAFNATTGEYTAPEAGRYLMFGCGSEDAALANSFLETIAAGSERSSAQSSNPTGTAYKSLAPVGVATMSTSQTILLKQTLGRYRFTSFSGYKGIWFNGGSEWV